MDSYNNGDSHISLVALHESINANCNVFRDIVEMVSRRYQSKWYRRMSRRIVELKDGIKESVVATRRKLCRNKERRSQDDECDIVCIGIDASLNVDANVFQDIVMFIHQRHLLAMQRQQDPSRENEIKEQNHCGTTNDSKKRFGFLRRAVKRIFTCSSCIDGKESENIETWIIV